MLPLSSNKKSDSFHRHAILNALTCITNKNEVFWSRTFISFGHCHVLREANRYSYKKISKLKAIIIGPKHSWHNTLKTYEVLSRTKFSAHINLFLNKSLPLQRKIYIHTTLRSNWSPSKNISHEPHSRTAVLNNLEEAFSVYVFQNLTYLCTKPRSKRVDRDVCLLTSELYQIEKANNTISQSKRTILDHESDRGSATQTNS